MGRGLAVVRRKIHIFFSSSEVGSPRPTPDHVCAVHVRHHTSSVTYRAYDVHMLFDMFAGENLGKVGCFSNCYILSAGLRIDNLPDW